MDFNGCARPSIADPFLPNKINEGRVADYREYQLSKRPNVATYFDRRLSAAEILEFGFQNVAIATGATWRSDGVVRQHMVPMKIADGAKTFTPDDLMAGNVPTGNVVVFDDDHNYMGGVLVELLVQKGAKVALITTSAFVSDWTNNTLEQPAIHRKLDALGVDIVLKRVVAEIAAGHVVSDCVYNGKTRVYGADAGIIWSRDLAMPKRQALLFGRPMPVTAMRANWIANRLALPVRREITELTHE